MRTVLVSKNEVAGADLAKAISAGAIAVDSWEIRAARIGTAQIYLSTTGWWGITRIGQPSRIARRRSIESAVRLAAKL